MVIASKIKVTSNMTKKNDYKTAAATEKSRNTATGTATATTLTGLRGLRPFHTCRILKSIFEMQAAFAVDVITAAVSL